MIPLFHSAFEIPANELPLELLAPTNLNERSSIPKFNELFLNLKSQNNDGNFYCNDRSIEEMERQTFYGLGTEVHMQILGMQNDPRPFRDGKIQRNEKLIPIDVKVIHHTNTHCSTTFADMNAKLVGKYAEEWKDLEELYVWKYCDDLNEVQRKNPNFPYKPGDVFFWKAFRRGIIKDEWQVPIKVPRKK